MTDKKNKLAAAVYDPPHKKNLLVLRQHVQEQLHINAKQKWRLKEMEEEKLHKQAMLDEKKKVIQDLNEKVKTLKMNRVQISEKLENANCKIKMQEITMMNMKEELEKSKEEKNILKIQIKKETEKVIIFGDILKKLKREQKKKKTLQRQILTLRSALNKQTRIAKEAKDMALMHQNRQKELMKSTMKQMDFNRSKEETKPAFLACEVKSSSQKELDDQQNDEACTVEVSSSIYRLEESTEQETEIEVMDCTFNHSMEVINLGLATCDAPEKSSSLKEIEDQQNHEDCSDEEEAVEVSSPTIYSLEESKEQENERDSAFNHSMEETKHDLLACDASKKSSSLKEFEDQQNHEECSDEEEAVEVSSPTIYSLEESKEQENERDSAFNHSMEETKHDLLACDASKKSSSLKEFEDQQNHEECSDEEEAVEVSVPTIYSLEESKEQENEMDSAFNHSMEETKHDLLACDASQKSSSLKEFEDLKTYGECSDEEEAVDASSPSIYSLVESNENKLESTFNHSMEETKPGLAVKRHRNLSSSLKETDNQQIHGECGGLHSSDEHDEVTCTVEVSSPTSST